MLLEKAQNIYLNSERLTVALGNSHSTIIGNETAQFAVKMGFVSRER